MVLFPNCKINLGLHILQKRADGFHNLETVFYPLPFTDALEIVHQQNHAESTLTVTGLAVDAPPEKNLCFKAFQLLKTDFPGLPQVQMHLHKVVPMGAGLGGGSANAAFTLLLLNKKFNLQLTQSQLLAYALALGSDCPFFIINKPCFATGRGERLTEIELNLSAYTIVLVNPKIHINTGWAFKNLNNKSPEITVAKAISMPVTAWKHALTNQFEEAVFAHYPEIGHIKKQLYQQGAVYAAMSGSGSTVFGLFLEKQPQLHFPEHYFMKLI